MRVLLIEGALYENGAVRLNLDLAVRLIRDRVSIRLLVLERPNVRTVPAPLALPVRFVSQVPRRFRSVVRHLPLPLLQECRRADVVVSGSEVGWGLPLGWLAAKVTRRPFGVIVHAPVLPAIEMWHPARLRSLLRWVHRHVDLAVCVSESLVPSVVENGLPRAKVTSFPTGIDVAEIQRRGRQRAGYEDLGLPRPVLVTVGRLAKEKGYDVLLRAHALARRKQPHHLVIVGDGPERDALKALTVSLGVADTVVFTGFLPDPQPMIAQADLFVLSSRYEGLGLVVMEALAHGTPVVSTDCAGPRFLLDQGRLGVLVPVGEATALASAIERHLESPAQLRRMAAQGPRWIQRFDQNQAADALLALLAGLVQEPVAEPGGVKR